MTVTDCQLLAAWDARYWEHIEHGRPDLAQEVQRCRQDLIDRLEPPDDRGVSSCQENPCPCT